MVGGFTGMMGAWLVGPRLVSGRCLPVSLCCLHQAGRAWSRGASTSIAHDEACAQPAWGLLQHQCTTITHW